MTTIEGVDLFRSAQVRITMADRQISAVEELEPARGGPLLAPGLVDLQVNGVYGADLNEHPLTVDTVAAVSRALLAAGTTSYLAAISTNAPEWIEHAVRVVAEAAREPAPDTATVAGIHLEGPFISAEDGPRGAHDARHVRPPDWDLFQRWQNAAGGMIRIVTLSPEWPGANEFIARAAGTGVLVAIGHTAATPRQIRDAVAAGARLATHLGNGAHALLHRHHNYVWEQLACDSLHAALIADGAHLPDAVLTVMLRAKAGRAFLVSDASAMTGAEPGQYHTANGRHVRLTEDGRLVMVANPELLAGSVRLLPHDVAHLVRAGITTLGQAWEMASTRPAALLGLPVAAGITVGAPADLVVFDWDGAEIAVREVVKGTRLGVAR